MVSDLNQPHHQQRPSQFDLLTTKIESEIKSEVPQQQSSSVPEAIPSSSLQAITQAAAALALDGDKEKTFPSKQQQGGRTCSLVDFDSFQKVPLNNLSNRSAHWDPKVFRKIAQLIDPPKSPPESPKTTSRPSSPDEKRFESELN